MKIFVILPLLLSIAYSINPMLEEMIKTRTKANAVVCISKVGATDDDIAPLAACQMPTTETGKCFLACMYKTEGFLDANGSIDRETSLRTIDQIKEMDENYFGKVLEMLGNCLGRGSAITALLQLSLLFGTMLASVNDGANECETAAALHECLLSEKTRVGLETINMD